MSKGPKDTAPISVKLTGDHEATGGRKSETRLFVVLSWPWGAWRAWWKRRKDRGSN